MKEEETNLNKKKCQVYIKLTTKLLHGITVIQWLGYQHIHEDSQKDHEVSQYRDITKESVAHSMNGWTPKKLLPQAYNLNLITRNRYEVNEVVNWLMLHVPSASLDQTFNMV